MDFEVWIYVDVDVIVDVDVDGFILSRPCNEPTKSKNYSIY
jgi:hypothetical protein